MPKPPAVVFVVRHGARLDAVDKQWHLTSPTPYDPPLTYGGWNQSRNLGVRIAGLLREYEQNRFLASSSSTSASLATPSQTPSGADTAVPTANLSSQNLRIIIHSSPFLRCVQTAIAISAGISQIQSSSNYSPPPPGTLGNPAPFNLQSLTGNSESNHHFEDLKSMQDSKSSTLSSPSKNKRGCMLRLDAFLGEWLTPDYFEQIPPPPDSVMMIASAKADLLRSPEAIGLISPVDFTSAKGFFPGGWNGCAPNAFVTSDSPTSMVYNISTRGRSGTLEEVSTGVNPSKRPILSKLSTTIPPSKNGYIPPTPAYAIKPSDPIPHGYVAHARDSCIDIDYQWDSMREPHHWGNGGEYGEEWSSMHQRFRKGLEHMISFYTSEHMRGCGNQQFPQCDNDDEHHRETILILVSHGAGCNAMIGALTDRPALLDIGISSLTMATRRSTHSDALVSTTSQNSLVPQHGLAEVYDVNVVASTDHLRPTSSNAIPNSSNRAYSATDISYRQRFNSMSNSADPRGNFLIINDSPSRLFSGPKIHHSPSRSLISNRSSSGLWGSKQAFDSMENIIPNFGDNIDSDPAINSLEKVGSTTSPLSATHIHNGLWKSGPLLSREPLTKRRWTVTDR
ncbi:hypothetical protein LOZ66_006553 [Ophidiomyces ophidiicola]|nr:hypothetical protein LOZ66_006553 [Ophidiomyces ophidiicola]